MELNCFLFLFESSQIPSGRRPKSMRRSTRRCLNGRTLRRCSERKRVSCSRTLGSRRRKSPTSSLWLTQRRPTTAVRLLSCQALCFFHQLFSFLLPLALMLGLLKMSNAEVKKAILSIDKENQLSDNTLLQFMNYAPSPEELASLKPFRDTPAKLAAADQFIMAVVFLLFLLLFLPVCAQAVIAATFTDFRDPQAGTAPWVHDLQAHLHGEGHRAPPKFGCGHQGLQGAQIEQVLPQNPRDYSTSRQLHERNWKKRRGLGF